MKIMKLRQIRLDKGLTTKDMAERLGITSAGYSRIESEQYTINIKMLIRLAEILECRTDEILDYDLKAILKRKKELYNKLLEQAKKYFCACFFIERW